MNRKKRTKRTKPKPSDLANFDGISDHDVQFFIACARLVIKRRLKQKAAGASGVGSGPKGSKVPAVAGVVPDGSGGDP